MNTNGLAKHYGTLTTLERFKLIIAATRSQDEQEIDRITNAGSRITLTANDITPYLQAFKDLAFFMYMELLNDSHIYEHSWTLSDVTYNYDDDKDGAKKMKASKKKTVKKPIWKRQRTWPRPPGSS